MEIYDLPLKLVSQLLFTVFCVILFRHKPYPDPGIDNVAEDGCLFDDWQTFVDFCHIGGDAFVMDAACDNSKEWNINGEKVTIGVEVSK